jgi:RNA polymerase sigma factor (sigma-70 family)
MTRAEAISQVYREEWRRMVGIVSQALPRGEAEDVVAEAFANAWQTATEMDPDRLTRYVWRCVWNGCADLHRQGRYSHEVELDPRIQTRGTREFDQADARIDISLVWPRLTGTQREMLYRYFWGGERYSDMSRERGASGPQARRAAFRGWQRAGRLLTGRAR